MAQANPGSVTRTRVSDDFGAWVAEAGDFVLRPQNRLGLSGTGGVIRAESGLAFYLGSAALSVRPRTPAAGVGNGVAVQVPCPPRPGGVGRRVSAPGRGQLQVPGRGAARAWELQVSGRGAPRAWPVPLGRGLGA